MPNKFITSPELSTPFPSDQRVWACPITGISVPKTLKANLRWRAELMERAETDTDLQMTLRAASAASLLFWVNTFVWTFRVMEPGVDGQARSAARKHIPVVTWEVQDRHLLALERAINEGTDLLTDKARDMGASWNHIIAIHHKWLFEKDSLFLEMSRVETDVDGADNPRALFVKHDYINSYLPSWMLPAIKRTRLHIVNLDNGSRIDGESSNKAAASGDRRRAILLDEFAKQENAESIKASTADVTPCRLVNSTVWGAGSVYSTWRNSGQIPVFEMPWWEHPEKGANRYIEFDKASGRYRIRSPWYDSECARRTPREIAEEIDMDHLGSGAAFFESTVIEAHRNKHARAVLFNATIDFKAQTPEDSIPKAITRKQVELV